MPKEDDPNHKWYAPGDDLSAFTGKDSMFVSRIFDWYLGEVQEGLKSGDWAKADEVVGMIDTYQQAKNKTLDISPKRMQAELKYNKMVSSAIARSAIWSWADCCWSFLSRCCSAGPAG